MELNSISPRDQSSLRKARNTWESPVVSLLVENCVQQFTSLQPHVFLTFCFLLFVLARVFQHFFTIVYSMDHSFFYSLYQSFEFFLTLSILLSMFCLSSLYSFMSLLQYNKILLKKIQHNSHHLAVATGLAFSSIHASLMMLCHLTMRRTSGKRHYLLIFCLFF